MLAGDPEVLGGIGDLLAGAGRLESPGPGSATFSRLRGGAQPVAVFAQPHSCRIFSALREGSRNNTLTQGGEAPRGFGKS